VQFQNPFFPLFNHWFPNRWLYPEVEAELRRLMAHTGDVPYSQMPYQLMMGGKLFGTIGPVFWLAPVALLSLRFSAGRQLLAAFVAMFLPFFANTGARFFIPSLPFLSIALAIALTEIPRVGTAAGLLALAFHAWSSWPGVLERWVPGFQWRIDPVNVRAALRMMPESEFLAGHWRDYNAGLLLDRFVPPGEVVFSPSMGQIVYHHREILGSFDSTAGRRAYRILITPLMPSWSNSWHREMRFPAVNTRRLRIQSRGNADNDVQIGELRFFNGDAEIVRSATWRISASRNPWEVQLAFDNDPLSWWTSGEAADRKTWIEVDFSHPVRLDRVTVDQIEDQRWMALQPVADAGGIWKPVLAEEKGTLSLPAPDLRMCLKDELRELGISWILILDGTPGAEDLRTRSPQWGIQQIAETNGYRLWKLQ
jgi:hypothetical protein